MTVKPRCTRTVVFSCQFLGERNEEAACFDAGRADCSDQPGTVQVELHLPAPVPAVFLHGRFAQRGGKAVTVQLPCPGKKAQDFNSTPTIY